MQDTSLGAGRSAFGATQWSAIVRAGAGQREPLEALAAAYWRPVYKFVRVALGKSNDDAKDLTQDFFATVFQPDWIARADPERGSFRTFLLASLKNFVRDCDKYRGAQKRGGGVRIVALDAADEAPGAGTPEQAFMKSWAEEVLREAIAALEKTARPQAFAAFRAYCVEGGPGVSYETVARSLGASVSEITNWISESRKELRAILVSRVGQYVSSEREIDGELRELFGG